jgi:hypothetical protein
LRLNLRDSRFQGRLDFTQVFWLRRFKLRLRDVETISVHEAGQRTGHGGDVNCQLSKSHRLRMRPPHEPVGGNPLQYPLGHSDFLSELSEHRFNRGACLGCLC